MAIWKALDDDEDFFSTYIRYYISTTAWDCNYNSIRLKLILHATFSLSGMPNNSRVETISMDNSMEPFLIIQHKLPVFCLSLRAQKLLRMNFKAWKKEMTTFWVISILIRRKLDGTLSATHEISGTICRLWSIMRYTLCHLELYQYQFFPCLRL